MAGKPAKGKSYQAIAVWVVTKGLPERQRQQEQTTWQHLQVEPMYISE